MPGRQRRPALSKKVYVTLQQWCEGSDAPRKALADAGFSVTENKLGRRLKREELFTLLADCDAAVAGVEPFDAEVLKALPKLKLLSRVGVGTDAIDLEAAKKLGIEVRITADEVAEPVAQMTVAMILALARNLPLHAKDFSAGKWTKRSGWLLSEWTIGLVGFGRIGRAVARLLAPFGCRILVSDPFIKDLPAGLEKRDLKALLAESDLVTLHAAGKDRLIGSAELSLMKPGARLVNTARGSLVDEKALLEALKSGKLSGAALDVYETEPYAGELASLPQVLGTPHVATLTNASRAAMELRAALNVTDFFRSCRSEAA